MARLMLFRNRPQCIAITRSGRRCYLTSRLHSTLCSTHLRAEKRQLHVKTKEA